MTVVRPAPWVDGLLLCRFDIFLGYTHRLVAVRQGLVAQLRVIRGGQHDGPDWRGAVDVGGGSNVIELSVQAIVI